MTAKKISLPPQKKAADNLCKRAKKILERQKKKPITFLPKDLGRLLYALETHQIELEIQNQELRNAQIEIEASRRKYTELYDFAPVGYLTLDKNGVILEANVTGAAMLGISKPTLEGKPMGTFMAGTKDRRTFINHCNKVLRSETKDTCELRLRKLKGTPFHVHLESIPSEDSKGKLVLIRTVISDITKRKRDEDAMAKLHDISLLMTTPENMEHILSQVLDAAIALSKADFGNIQLWDAESSCLRLQIQRGFPQWWIDYWNNVSEGRGTCGTALSRRERVIIEDIEQSSMFVGTEALEIQRRVGVRAVQSTPLICRLGILRGMFSTHYKAVHRPDERELRLLDLLARNAADIIGQVQSGEELQKAHTELEERVRERTRELVDSREQLRNLSSHLQDLREEERTNIAREIHDDLGQSLAALKMDLSWIAGKLPNDSRKLKERLKSDLGEVDKVLESVKTVCTELRPGILDNLGLTAALEWQAGEFQKRTGIRCKVSFDPEDIEVDTALRTPLFRIFQEALTNVLKHAKATRVTASLKRMDSTIVFGIDDNGIGIKEKDPSKTGSFGLLGMRERVYPFGGTLSVKGLKKKGTSITVTLPIP